MRLTAKRPVSVALWVGAALLGACAQAVGVQKEVSPAESKRREAAPERKWTPEAARSRANLQKLRSKGPVRGVAIHFCSCAAPCACMFGTGDMEKCSLAAVYHFTEGGYAARTGGAEIKGLTAVAVYRPNAEVKRNAVHKSGLMKNGKPVELVVYLPQEATAKQESTLKFVLLEHVQVIGMGNLLFRRAPIAFKKAGDGYEVTIKDVFHARTEAIRGKDRKQMTVDHVPFYESDRWLLGRSKVHTYQDPEDPDWKWDLPGTNGAWTNFAMEAINHGP